MVGICQRVDGTRATYEMNARRRRFVPNMCRHRGWQIPLPLIPLTNIVLARTFLLCALWLIGSGRWAIILAGTRWSRIYSCCPAGSLCRRRAVICLAFSLQAYRKAQLHVTSFVHCMSAESWATHECLPGSSLFSLRVHQLWERAGSSMPRHAWNVFLCCVFAKHAVHLPILIAWGHFGVV